MTCAHEVIVTSTGRCEDCGDHVECVACGGPIPDDGDGYCHVAHPDLRFCRKSCLRAWPSSSATKGEP